MGYVGILVCAGSDRLRCCPDIGDHIGGMV